MKPVLVMLDFGEEILDLFLVLPPVSDDNADLRVLIIR